MNAELWQRYVEARRAERMAKQTLQLAETRRSDASLTHSMMQSRLSQAQYELECAAYEEAFPGEKAPPFVEGEPVTLEVGGVTFTTGGVGKMAEET